MSADLTGRSLVAVFAHPDDESIACGGVLALCADRGVRVTVICATHGENHDGKRDGFLPWTGGLGERIEAELRRLRPDAVVTFGADGLYWHPDHIAICTATTAAVDALEDAAPALYYVTMPPGQMRRLVDEVWKDKAVTSHLPLFGVSNPDAFGVGAAEPTLVVDITGVAARKLAAMKCHRSQIADGAIARVSEADAPRLLGVEHFHRPPGSRVRSRHGLLEQLCA